MSTVQFVSHLDDAMEEINAQNELVLQALARAAVEKVQDAIVKEDLVDTGFLRAGVYAFWSDGSDYNEALADATVLVASTRRDGKFVDHSKQIADEVLGTFPGEGGVSFVANYAGYVDDRFPFFVDAMESLSLEDADYEAE